MNSFFSSIHDRAAAFFRAMSSRSRLIRFHKQELRAQNDLHLDIVTNLVHQLGGKATLTNSPACGLSVKQNPNDFGDIYECIYPTLLEGPGDDDG